MILVDELVLGIIILELEDIVLEVVAEEVILVDDWRPELLIIVCAAVGQLPVTAVLLVYVVLVPLVISHKSFLVEYEPKLVLQV